MKHNLTYLLMTCLLTACAGAATPTATVTVPDVAPPEATSTLQAAAATATPEPTRPAIARPFPQHSVYAAGSTRPNHRPQTQLDDDVRAFYDDWKKNYLLEAGSTAEDRPLYRVAFGKEAPDRDKTVSEGQGYGMMIVAFMAGYDPDARILFDGLWDFARAHPSNADARLMDWSVPENSGNDSAFDGDADMAYALLLADAQWGSDGRIDYQADAKTVITGILESTIGPESRMPMLGDWTDPNGSPYNQYTPRASDFMLVNFRAYGKVTQDPVWDEIITKSQSVMSIIQEKYSPETGLLPDFIIMDGEDHAPRPSPAEFLESLNDGNYYYNAGRVPWRIGEDALLNDNATSRAIAQKISLWAEKTAWGVPRDFRAGYDLQGNPVPGSDYFTSFFVAPLGVAAMSNPSQQGWLNAIYDSVYAQRENYYEDSINLLCLLSMSGNSWTP